MSGRLRQLLCAASSSSRLGVGLEGEEEKIVLGIESSCDDTGVGVVSSSGQVLGEALHSQLLVHLK